MNKKTRALLEPLIPFIVLGITIALVIALLVFFSYIFFWGILIGAILWAIFTLKNYFFPKPPSKKRDGRIIEHDDNL